MDVTSETTVWNIYCLFPDIYDSLQLLTYFFSLLNHKVRKTLFKVEDLIYPWDRHI